MEIPINSSIPGIDWPALPSSHGAGKLATLFQLEQSQWWPEEKLRQHQFKQINTLLQHCVEHVPYYQEILGKSLPAGGISEETWHNIPILSRHRLQQAGEKLRAKNLPPVHGKVSVHSTSGSTGKPVETLSTDITNFFWDVLTLRDHLWHRRDFSDKLAVIRYTLNEKAKRPGGITSENWGRATAGVIQTGQSVMFSVSTPASELASRLQKEDPNYLLTHPSVLQELALHCQRENIQLPSLREVRTVSEAQPDGLRELCQEVWGVKLVDFYSSIELGYLALQCPEHDHYHVQSEGVLLEILDDNGKPCAPGEIGRVIVTNLHNYASPLIRYELGDYAEVGEPCECGRGLPVLKRIMGRYRNLITMPTGEKLWPLFGIPQFHNIAPIQQFQAVQHTLHDIEVRLILPRPLKTEEKEKLTALFQKMLGDCFNYDIQQVENLQRSANGKYEEFISEVDYKTVTKKT